MAVVPPIPIPAAFDALDLADKRAYLAALRDRLEQSLDASHEQVEDAVFAEIEHRRAEAPKGSVRLSREELMRPLRAKYG